MAPVTSRFTLRPLAVLTAVTVLSGMLAPFAEAANRYWGGKPTNLNFEHINNWASIPRGATGASVPGPADVAIFNNSGTTVQIRSAVSVLGLILAPTWTGSVLQGTGTIIAGTTGFRVGSGRFIGGNAAITVRGNYTQTGGIVTGIQNNMSVSGSLALSKGGSSIYSTFTSTGTVTFNGALDQNFTVGANVTKSFRNLTINNNGGGTSDDIVANVNGGLSLSGALTITVGDLDVQTNDVALVVRRGVTLVSNAQSNLTLGTTFTASGNIVTGALAAISPSGATTFTLNGIDQTLDTNGVSFPNMVIASSSGTTLTSDQQVSSSLTINAGSELSLDTFTFGATGATFSNLGLLHQNTGKLAHTATAFGITNSSYSDISTVTTDSDVSFTITDCDGNINGTSADTIPIVMTLLTGDSETVILTETAVHSCVFRYSPLYTRKQDPITNNGLLESSTATTGTATFTDAQDGLSNTDTVDFTILSSSGGGGGSTGGGGGGGGGSRGLSSGNTTSHSVTTTGPLTSPKIPSVDASSLKAHVEERMKKRMDALKALKSRVQSRAQMRAAKRK